MDYRSFVLIIVGIQKFNEIPDILNPNNMELLVPSKQINNIRDSDDMRSSELSVDDLFALVNDEDLNKDYNIEPHLEFLEQLERTIFSMLVISRFQQFPGAFTGNLQQRFSDRVFLSAERTMGFAYTVDCD